MAFESLDDRMVLSSMSALPSADASQCAPEMRPLESVNDENSGVGVSGGEASIQAAGFNQAPMGSDGTVMMSGMNYVFNTQDFGFSDPNQSPPDQLMAVKIDTLPARGTLMFGGAGVAHGQYISASSISNGQFQFITSGVESPAYASFTFQVQDNGGTIGGGSDLDPSANTLTLFFNTPQTNFVRGLYVDVLERQPEGAGLGDWLNRLDSGSSRAQVAASIWESAEHRGLQVDDYYQRFLNRAADVAGRDNWINQFLAGASEATVMAQFMTTQEFLAANPNNDALVIAVYRDILNRDPEPAGQSYWVNALTNGQQSFSEVATGLINTNERHLRLVDSYYSEYFRRPADSYGEAYWTDQLNQNLLDDQDVVVALLSTNEYYNLSH